MNTITVFLYNTVIVTFEQSENIERFHVKELLSQIFQLVKNLSGAVWTKPQWHDKNDQDWKFSVTKCAKPQLWGRRYSLLHLATFVYGISFFIRRIFW